MEEKKKVMIDAGHGGTKDPGAVFEDRMEKDDTLRLALAVGRILEENGVNVVYTRSTDVYDTPYQKAEMGNEAGADYFVSLHRNAASEPGKGSGVMTLVYKTGRESEQLAERAGAHRICGSRRDRAPGFDCAAENADAGGSG